jgi:hypothetical protein
MFGIGHVLVSAGTPTILITVLWFFSPSEFLDIALKQSLLYNGYPDFPVVVTAYLLPLRGCEW